MLALQNGLIDQDQLVAAFRAWTSDKGSPIAECLVARGALETDQCAVVDAMVSLHLKKHGGNAERSLAAVSTGRSTRESLAQIRDADIGVSLGYLGSRSTQDVGAADWDRTAS
jgi:hypothetical protein